jgi:hypothetical protein
MGLLAHDAAIQRILERHHDTPGSAIYLECQDMQMPGQRHDAFDIGSDQTAADSTGLRLGDSE